MTHVCLDSVLAKKKTGEPCFVLSIGIAHVWAFDDLMLSHGCTVYAVDPSMGPDKPEFKRGDKHKFWPVGIAARDGSDGGKDGLTSKFASAYAIPSSYKLVSIETLIKAMGTAHLDIVRMDCEGAEWPVLDSWMASGVIDPIDQLLLEIHVTPEGLTTQVSTLSKLFGHEKIMFTQVGGWLWPREYVVFGRGFDSVAPLVAFAVVSHQQFDPVVPQLGKFF